jgi:hypothetical protein
MNWRIDKAGNRPAGRLPGRFSQMRDTRQLRGPLQLESERVMCRFVSTIEAARTEVANRSASPREYSMIDDHMNAEEVAENRKQREAAENATDDGMPVAPESKVGDVDEVQDITLKQWVKSERKWPGTAGTPMQWRRLVLVKRNVALH